jgi:hypothetical protein
MNLLTRFAACSCLLLFSTHALARDEIRPSVERNAPPKVQLDHYARFELKPVVLAPEYAEHEANKKALVSVQENIDQRLGAWTEQRNAEPAKDAAPAKLIIEPVIEKVRFISGGKRFFAGAFAGSSQILMKLRLTDAATQEVIAEPEFYQHARGMAGAWTIGGSDNAMLARIATLAQEYVTANYAVPAGGPTGWEAE